MSSSYKQRFYSPQFSEQAVVSVCRLAWALEKPMTKAVDHMVQLLPSLVDPSKVCLACRDRSRCSCCAFHNHSASPSTVAALSPQ